MEVLLFLRPMYKLDIGRACSTVVAIFVSGPSLKTLCMLAVLDDDLDRSQLPQELK